jgi:hypothetical protein
VPNYDRNLRSMCRKLAPTCMSDVRVGGALTSRGDPADVALLLGDMPLFAGAPKDELAAT